MTFILNQIAPFVAFLILTVVSVRRLLVHETQWNRDIARLEWLQHFVFPIITWGWLFVNAVLTIYCFREMLRYW